MYPIATRERKHSLINNVVYQEELNAITALPIADTYIYVHLIDRDTQVHLNDSYKVHLDLNIEKIEKTDCNELGIKKTYIETECFDNSDNPFKTTTDKTIFTETYIDFVGRIIDTEKQPGGINHITNNPNIGRKVVIDVGQAKLEMSGFLRQEKVPDIGTIVFGTASVDGFILGD